MHENEYQAYIFKNRVQDVSCNDANMDVKKLPLEQRAQCAAYMRATHNMSQAEIGQALGGLSQPHVSRLLTYAEKKNYLVIEQRFASELFSDAWLGQIEALLAPAGLNDILNAFCKRSGLHAPRLRVFESGSGNTEARLTQRRARFGRIAAGRLIELIEASKIVGVAWGRTIKSLVNGIEASRQPIRRSRPIEFTAVCAELVALAQHEHSSSRLADAFSEVINGTAGNAVQLTGFPAYIPRHYDQTMRDSIWRFISDTPGHSRVFSGSNALIHRMDMLISSVGSSRMPVLGSFEELVMASGLPADELRRLVVGDLGGILIPRDDLSSASEKLIEELNEIWTGIKTEHVRAMADRAIKDTAMSGVVVVAIQAERGDTAFELIRRGLVNELILDQAAANQLHKRLAEN